MASTDSALTKLAREEETPKTVENQVGLRLHEPVEGREAHGEADERQGARADVALLSATAGRPEGVLLLRPPKSRVATTVTRRM